MDAAMVAQWAKELSDVRDAVVREQTNIRELLADSRKQVGFLRKREEHLFGLISGREHEQLPLPDPERAAPAAEPAPKPKAAAAKRASRAKPKPAKARR